MTADPISLDDVTRRLVQCFQDVFPELDDDAARNAVFGEVEEWDSLSSLTLVAVVEDEFQVILDDDLVAELTSFERIRDNLAGRA